MLRLSVSLRPTSGPLLRLPDPAATLAVAPQLGYDGVNVAVRDAAEAQEAVDRCRAAGIPLGVFMTGPLWTRDRLSLSDAATTGAARRRIAEIVGVAAGDGVRVLLGSVLGRLPPAGPAREPAQALLLDALRAVARDASAAGAQLLLEPLNRYESDVAPTAAAAAALADRVGEPLPLVLDSFHANIEEADPCAAARGHAHRVGLVQLADSNRRMPGDGHFPTAAWIAALRAGGYEGEYAIEAEFGPDPLADARRALERCRAYGL